MELPGGSSKKKSLNIDLNLVPYIDLLSVCICFLLITAVWIQIGVVEVKQTVGEGPAKQKRYSLELKLSSPANLEVVVKQKDRVVKRSTLKEKDLDSLDASFDKHLESWKKSVGPLGDAVSFATVSPLDGVEYGSLVRVMDRLRQFEIVDLGIVAPKGKL